MNGKDRELQELMNAEMDGVATAQESARLRSLLKTRPDARSEFERLKGVVAALEHLEMEEPPASLKQDILRAARTHAAPAPERTGWAARVASWMGGGGGPRQAYSFAVGAALGVLVLALLTGNLLSRPGSDSRSWTGTMLPLRGTEGYRVINSRTFTLAQGSFLAQALSGRGGFAVKLAGDLPVGSELELTYEPSDWDVVSLTQETTGNEVLLGTGRLSVRMRRPGHSQYLLELARKGTAGSPLRMAIHSPDGYVQGELDMRALRSGS
jgi:hypothetical protein